MRRLTFPPATSYSNPSDKNSGPWGLADLIVERVLGAPQHFSSLETCNRVTVLSKKFKDIRGVSQAGKSVLLTDSEYEFLSKELLVAIHGMAGGQGVLPPHLAEDIAVYMRSVYTADIVPDEAATEGATAPGGVA